MNYVLDSSTNSLIADGVADPANCVKIKCLAAEWWLL